MSRIKEIKNYIVSSLVGTALGVSSLLTPINARADGITEDQCLANYQSHKNTPECQEIYKEYFIIGDQGPVTNTPGGCENKIDDDRDGFVDGRDPDCYTDNVYNPGNTEDKKDNKQFTPTQTPIVPPCVGDGGDENCEEENGGGNGRDGNGKKLAPFSFNDLESGLNFLLTNTSSTETRQGQEVNVDGDGQIYDVYLRFKVGDKHLVALLGEYSTSNLSLSDNIFGDFGTKNIEFYKLGLLVQSELMNGRLKIEPGINYAKKKTTIPNIFNEEDTETMKITSLSIKALFDLIQKGDTKLALVADLTQDFINYTQDSSGVGENPSIGRYGGGLDLITKIFNAQALVMYKQFYNSQSFEAGNSNNGDNILDSWNVDLAARLGFNNLYGFGAAQIPVSANGIEERVIGAGAGFNRIGKFPVGFRVIYINKNTKIETEPTQTDTEENIYGLYLILNGRNDRLNSYLNPFTAHNQN